MIDNSKIVTIARLAVRDRNDITGFNIDPVKVACLVMGDHVQTKEELINSFLSHIRSLEKTLWTAKFAASHSHEPA